MSIQYYILDTETTGTGNQHEVIEISIIRCSDKVQITRFIKAEFPERASLDALAVNNKSLEDLKNGISKEEAIEEVEKFLNLDNSSPEFRCIVAHNASFDQRFLHNMWAKCGKSFPANMFLDTMQLTRLAAKKMGIIKPKVNLAAACEMFQIKKTGQLHSSKADTRATFFLWKKLTEDLNIDYIQYIKNVPHKIDDSMNNIEDLDLSDVI